MEMPDRAIRKNPMRQFSRLATLMLTSLILAGCATTQLTSTWVEPGSTHTEFKDVIVFGVAANETIRRVYEDSFVAALKERGVKARPGYNLLPQGGLSDAKTLKKAVEMSGADAVIITHLVGENTETVYVAPRTYVTPSLYGNLYPYYGRVYDYVTEPGYYAQFKVLQLETNVYSAAREKLVWSGRSQTLDPASENTTINEVIAVVTQSLADSGFLPK